MENAYPYLLARENSRPGEQRQHLCGVTLPLFANAAYDFALACAQVESVRSNKLCMSLRYGAPACTGWLTRERGNCRRTNMLERRSVTSEIARWCHHSGPSTSKRAGWRHLHYTMIGRTSLWCDFGYVQYPPI